MLASEEVGIRISLRNRKQTARDLASTRRDLQSTADAANRSGRAAGRAGDSAGRSGRGWKRLGGVFKWVKRGALGAVGAVGGLATAALWKGFNRLKSLDNATAKLTGLGHSAKSVEKIMSNATAAVKGTAFGLDDAATASAGAVAAGIKPGTDLERHLRLVADTATIGGTSVAEMGAIFNKVATSNKVNGGVINQIQERGIGLTKALADHFGVTAEEASKMVSRGEVSFADFSQAMTSLVGGAAEESGKTFSGSWANMWASLGRSGAGVLSGVFNQLAPTFQSITGAMGPLEDKAGKFGEVLGKKLKPMLAKVGPAVKTFIDQVTHPGDDSALSKISAAFITVKDAIAAVDWSQIASTVGGIVSTAFDVLAGVVKFAADHLEELRDILVPLGAAFVVYRASVVAVTAAQKVWGVVTTVLAAKQKMMTAAQWALNIAMKANPLGLIITGITLLAAGLVMAYKKSETFRKIVDATWNKVLKPLGVFLKTVLVGAIKLLATYYITMGRVGITAFKGLLQAAFWVMEGILTAAEKGLGWLPGIGDKVKDAKAAFKGFKTDTINALDRVGDKLAETQGMINNLGKPKTATITVKTIMDGGVARPGMPAARAAGGPVVAGRPYIVGEHQPELFVPNTSGRILPSVPTAPPLTALSAFDMEAAISHPDSEVRIPVSRPGQPTVVQVVLDRRVLAEALLDDLDSRAARR